MKTEKKLIWGIALWICLCLCIPQSARAGALSGDFIKTAKSYLGSRAYSHLCLAYINDSFYETYGIRSTACCAKKYGDLYLDSRSRKIPVGADVFFYGSSITCSMCGSRCGHVGIYAGNGYIIHSWQGIQKMKISDVEKMGYTYRGWGWHAGMNLSRTGIREVDIEKTISGKARLSWKKEKNAVGYEIYRKAYGGRWQKIKTIRLGTKTSYLDQKIKKNKLYYYKVRAVYRMENGKYTGPFSEIKKVKIRTK